MKHRRQPLKNYDRYALGLMAFQSGRQLYGQQLQLSAAIDDLTALGLTEAELQPLCELIRMLDDMASGRALPSWATPQSLPELRSSRPQQASTEWSAKAYLVGLLQMRRRMGEAPEQAARAVVSACNFSRLLGPRATTPAKALLSWEKSLRRTDGQGAPRDGSHRTIMAEMQKYLDHSDTLDPATRRAFLQQTFDRGVENLITPLLKSLA